AGQPGLDVGILTSSYIDLGYSMADARDLSNIYVLDGPLDGANCVQGAPFSSIGEHFAYMSQ
ncbi:MAG: hypothetical protein AAF633_28500, partial [Chloroflexota bacterium]